VAEPSTAGPAELFAEPFAEAPSGAVAAADRTQVIAPAGSSEATVLLSKGEAGTSPGAAPESAAEPGVAGAGAGTEDEGVPGQRRSASKIFMIVVGLVVLLVVGCGIGGVILYVNRDKPTTAAAGDCLKGDGIDPGNRKTSDVSLKTVPCGDKTAKYKVVGRAENQSESAATADSRLCDPYPGTEFIYWEGVSGERGTVLCLMTNPGN
jgi:hypothetical protein